MANCANPLLAARLYKPVIGKSIVKILPRRVEMGYNEYVSKYGRENLFSYLVDVAQPVFQDVKKNGLCVVVWKRWIIKKIVSLR